MIFLNMQEVLSSYRCECGKMLLKGFIFIGEIEIKCRYCKRTNTISGINGNLSNDHRYLIVSELDGTIIRATSSAEKILNYAPAALVGAKAHTVLGFKPEHYAYFAKKLEEHPMKSFIFQSQETPKSGKASDIQVGVRYTVAMTGKKIFVFDIERNAPSLPKPLGVEKVSKKNLKR